MTKAIRPKKTAANRLARFHGHLAGIIESLIAARNKFTLWLLLIGFAMCAVSMTSNFGTLSFNGALSNGLNAFRDAPPGSVTTKQVGYLWALNWSVFSTLVAPAIVWFAIGALQALNTTLSNLCDRGMLRTNDFEKVQYAALHTQWLRHMERNRAMFAFIFAMVFYVIMADWWSVVANPILHPADVTQTVSDPAMEFDWSVSSLYPHTHVNAGLLLVFGFVGYVVFAASVPALVISLNLCTVFYMLFLTTARTKNGEQIQFAAVPTASKDRHFGFNVFSDLFHNFLMMSLFILIGLWLMAMQNVYLRDMRHADIYGMLTSEMSHAIHDFIQTGNFVALKDWLLEPAKQLIYNPQVAWAALLFPIVCIVSVMGCWLVLGMKARKAQEFSQEHVGKLAAEYGLSKDLLEERLNNEMEFWPVGWINSNQLLILMLLLFASLVSYRAIILPVFLCTTLGVAALIKYFWFSRKKR